MNDWRINFGQNLRHLRQVYGMTHVEMAKIVGICVSTYRKIERCDETVRIHSGRVHRVCDHFGLSTDEILYQNWREMLENKK